MLPMSETTVLTSVYLNKKDSNLTNDWVYYRLVSKGEMRDVITVCQVEWPKFTDIDLIWDENKAVIDIPGVTGLTSALSMFVP